MPSAFETMFAAAAVPAIAGTHGKSVTHTPKGGSPRTFIATAVRSDATRYIDVPMGIDSEDAVLVSCQKHATLGIATAQLGDSVTVGGVGYSFDGSVTDEIGNNWTLRFVLRRPFERGGNRLPR